MYLTILDLILILILFVFIAFGFTMGLIQAIGAIVGLVVGTWVAGLYYEPMAQWLEPIILGHATAARIISFILIFTVVNRLSGLAFWFISKVFKLFSIIPFTKSLNRILGAILGLLEGVLAIGVVMYFITQLPISEWYSGIIADSQVAVLFISLAGVLVPLLPEIINTFNPLNK